jgi:hypothetical protein
MRRRTTIFALLLACAAAAGLGAYYLEGQSWPAGTVTIYVQLGAAGSLTDGCGDWSCVAVAAINRWNANLGRLQLAAVANATQSQGEHNGRNDMFFASDMYGDSFGSGTLAETIYWYRGSTITEADIGFNSKYKWDSYRGNQRSSTVDLRRVAIHELGHVIGLDHPDDYGQSVSAIMNSRVSNIDDLVADDIAGGQSIYGSPSTSPSTPTGPSTPSAPTPVVLNFPPRNETYAFRTWLETVYASTLGRPGADSYCDPEGSVVWVQEYLRYRLNLCTDAQATDRVRTEITAGTTPAVCGTLTSTTLNFPPRNDTYAFRLALEDLYKTTLQRGAVKTSVNAEGDVVWIQEYLRYRLGSCTHDQATAKVLQQIQGGSVPAVCK